MKCKTIEVTKRTEGESKSYIEGFKDGAEMALKHGAILVDRAYELMVQSHNNQFGNIDDRLEEIVKIMKERRNDSRRHQKRDSANAGNGKGDQV